MQSILWETSMSTPDPMLSQFKATTTSTATISQTNDAGKQVIVVGAGIAGLTACIMLLKKGYKVIMVEAKSIAGGRIAVHEMGDTLVPTGAMYIHNPNHNSILPLIDKSHIKESNPTDPLGLKINSAAIDSEESLAELFGYYAEYKNNMVPGQLGNPISAENNDEIVRLAFKIAQDAYVSYRGISYTKLQAMQQEERILLEALFRDSSSSGSSSSSSSYQEDLLVTCKGGYYNALIKPILTDLHKNANFKAIFDSPVSTIDCREGPIKVTMQKGGSLSADSVVCAVPLVILQRNQILLQGLDANKRTAIEHLRPCLQNQITLEFDNLDWMGSTKAATSINLIEEREGYPTLIHGNNLYNIMEGTPKILKFSLYAEQADFKGKTDAEIKNYLMNILKRHFDNNVPEPKSFHITRWNEDPYTGQSWSRPSGLTTLDELKALQEMNSTGNLCLAGEYTAGFGGDVNAAHISGIRAANLLAQALELKSSAKAKVGL